MRLKIRLHNKVLSASLPPLCETERRVIPMTPLYSGGECDVNGFDSPAIVDIETLIFEDEPPALIEHADELKVGRLVNLRKEQVNGKWQVACEADVHGTIYAKQLLEYLDADIHGLGPSIGISRGREYNVKHVPLGQTINVNGRTFSGPVDVLYNGFVTEGSFVSRRGDPEAKCLLAAIRNNNKGETIMSFTEFFASKGISQEQFDAMTEEEQAALKAEYEALGREGDGTMEASEEDGTTAPAGDATETLREAAVEVIAEELADATAEEIAVIVQEVTAEVNDLEPALGASARIGKAKALAKQKATALRAKAKQPKANVAMIEQRRIEGLKALQATFKTSYASRIIANAISNGEAVDSVAKALGTIEKTKPKTMQANMGYAIGAPGKGISKQDVLTVRLARTMGWKDNDIGKFIHFQTEGGANKVLNASIRDLNRPVSFKELAIESTNSIWPGYLSPHASLMDTLPEMRQACRQKKGAMKGNKAMEASLGFSSVFMTDILYAIISASLELQLEKAPAMYREFTREVTTKDFSAEELYTSTLNGRLRAISETGQLSHLSFGTTKLQYQTDPYGATFAIPEMVLIQDNLGAFAQLVQQLSELPEESVEHDVAMIFQAMMAGFTKDQGGVNAFFSAANNNIVSTNSRMDENGIQAAFDAAKKFTNDNGYPLSPIGSFALVPSSLAFDAERLFTSAMLFYGGTGGDNPVRGKLPHKEWLWLNSNFIPSDAEWRSDYLAMADKAWLYMADPQKRPAVIVSKLAGYTAPQIKQYDMDPNVWGTQYQLIYPYGITPMYTNGAILMTGQA